jgi:hypothetical protein
MESCTNHPYPKAWETPLWPIQPPIQWVPGAKRPEHEADCLSRPEHEAGCLSPNSITCSDGTLLNQLCNRIAFTFSYMYIWILLSIILSLELARI